jgi:hypothetical protein
MQHERVVTVVGVVTQAHIEGWVVEMALQYRNLYLIQMSPEDYKLYEKQTFGKERIVLAGTAEKPVVDRVSKVWSKPQGKSSHVCEIRPRADLSSNLVALVWAPELRGRRSLSGIEVRELSRLAWNFVVQYAKAHYGSGVAVWDDQNSVLVATARWAIINAQDEQLQACPKARQVPDSPEERALFSRGPGGEAAGQWLRYWDLLNRVARQLVYVEMLPEDAAGIDPLELQRVV